ncbi:histidinol-phosphate transaminase [Comamonas flocculans]|uniref:Histidinol-phosphate aminotransferase n=1 Tax=Comamonas flocculans TaxID=2597701 RepID=A0A5B8RYY2_9BURK|nr:histidinol-phosphate transaminase [Comamonas flocculans]QEA14014.1 histidinol-phosphate transaminase [Comamonas flocculans]
MTTLDQTTPAVPAAAHASPLARIRADVRAMHAYAVQPAQGLLKLDAMENPHRLPEDLQARLGQRLGQVAVNRYPGAQLAQLREALLRHAGPPAGWSLMLGNGSDELISLLVLACGLPGASVLAPEPGFVMYAMSARLQGLGYHGVPLRADFSLDEAALLRAIERERPALLFLAYPNNPTGTLWDTAAIARAIAAQGAHGGLVVMDEAYQPFAACSWIERVRERPEAHRHVLVLRTLSKFGLAGIRLGYLMGDAALIAEIDKVRPPYNVSVLNAECALFALEHEAVFAAQAQDIRAQRARLIEALAQMPGVQAYPSEANMILVRVPDAARAFEGMRSKGVLVKNVSTMHPLLANCLRLTVGTAEENTAMLQSLSASI